MDGPYHIHLFVESIEIGFKKTGKAVVFLEECQNTEELQGIISSSFSFLCFYLIYFSILDFL